MTISPRNILIQICQSSQNYWLLRSLFNGKKIYKRKNFNLIFFKKIHEIQQPIVSILFCGILWLQTWKGLSVIFEMNWVSVCKLSYCFRACCLYSAWKLAATLALPYRCFATSQAVNKLFNYSNVFNSPIHYCKWLF